MSNSTERVKRIRRILSNMKPISGIRDAADDIETVLRESPHYRAEFLWPPEEDSVEQAAYEFANGATEAYQKLWYGILVERIKAEHK